MESANQFVMPMFRSFVLKPLQPWIYVLTAFCFQFSGCVYLGALEAVRGTTNFMIEDLVFLLFSGLAGMAVDFPLLFRMKFRFTNQQLLCGSACVIMLCNYITMSSSSMLILAPVCFISGMAKIQGTFECMSNIQLWITPKRDFGVFFPVLHIILLTAIVGGGWLASVMAYHWSWQTMHWLTMGTMSAVVLLQLLLCKPFCPMPQRIPFRGIDFLSALLICIVMLMASYVMIYGNYYEWFYSFRLRLIAGLSVVLFALLLLRLRNVKQPYVNLRIFRYRNVVAILTVTAIAEVLLGVEHTMEEILYAEVVVLEEHTKAELSLWALPGIYIGVGITLFWLGHKRWKVWHLFALAFGLVMAYAVYMYLHLDMNAPYEQYRVGCALRGCAYAIFAASLMWSLHESVPDLNEFFMSLFIFNIMHMYLAGAMSFGLYSHLFSIQLGDNIARYSGYLTATSIASKSQLAIMTNWLSDMMAITIKQVYGLVIWTAAGMTMCFLLLHFPRIRTQVRKVPYWAVYAVEYIGRLGNLKRD